MKNFLLLIALVVTLIACKKDQEDAMETVMRVNHFKQTCYGVAEMTCYLVQTGDEVGGTSWGLLYSEIEGFEFEEGYIQTLKVRITKVPNPPADASDLRYTLLEVISRERAQ